MYAQTNVDDLISDGLDVNPTIFDHAIKNSTAYESANPREAQTGQVGEALFFEVFSLSSLRDGGHYARLPIFSGHHGQDQQRDGPERR